MNNAAGCSYLNVDILLATKDNRELPPRNRLFFVKSLDQNQGHPTRKFKQNTWNIIFCFLRLFQSFLKAYLCKLIQIDLFDVLSWKFRP